MILTGIVAGAPRTRSIRVKKGTPEERGATITEVMIVDQDTQEGIVVGAWDAPDSFKDLVPGKSATIKVARATIYKGQARATIAGQKAPGE